MDATQPLMAAHPAKRPVELAELAEQSKPSESDEPAKLAKLAKLTNSSTPTAHTTATTPTTSTAPSTPSKPSTPSTPTTLTTPTTPSTPTTPTTPTSEKSLPDTVDFDLTDDNPDDDKKVLYAFRLDLGDWCVESLFVSTRRQYKHALGHEVGIFGVTHPWCEVDVWLKPDHFDEIAVISDISTNSDLHTLLNYLPIGYDVVGGFIDNLENQNSTYCTCKRCVDYFSREHD